MTIASFTYDGVTMSLGNVGDGLSQAMKLRDDGLADNLVHGDTVLVVCEAEVKAVTFEPSVAKDLESPLVKKVVLRGVAATITDAPAVRKLLDKHRKALDAAREIEGATDVARGRGAARRRRGRRGVRLMATRGKTFTIIEPTTFVTETCYLCGVLFAMTEQYHAQRVDAAEKGSFYCPNGHQQHYVGKSAKEKAADARARGRAATRAPRRRTRPARRGRT